MMKNNRNKDTLGLYIHIPFCVRKCAYCDFYSVADKSLHKAYIDALCIQMKDLSKLYFDRSFDTVYIGGGTPSVLESDLIKQLMNGINESFNVSKGSEVTLEANPATLNDSKLDAMLENGINRLSIGCQSSNDEELKALGRLHSYGDFVDTYDLARKAGFSNISVDLMYSLPSQNIHILKHSLESIVSLSPEHISLYGLKIEPGTLFYKNRDKMIFPDDDTFCDMYLMASEYLDNAGYNKYEISNFAHEGKESRHNLRYWNFDQYLGLGPGAHSYTNGRRFAYRKDILKYISSVNEGIDPEKSENRVLLPNDIINETFMLKMRLVNGVEDFRAYNISENLIDRYVNGGFLKRVGFSVRFTDRGFLVSNYILSDLISFD